MTELGHFKTILENEKKKMTQSLDQSAENHLQSNELSQYDNHPADNATELVDREYSMAIETHQKKELIEINEAIAAIDAGTYGQCKTCQKKIPSERLEAIPTTLYCIEHTGKKNMPTDRPIEEEILSHQFQNPNDTYNDFQQVAKFGISESGSEVPEDF